MTPVEKARAFLDIAPQFRLGDLITEQSHPLTVRLSDLAQSDLPQALAVLRKVDLEALRELSRHGRETEILASEIGATLNAGGRIFLGGCGATGRLALVCETLWRQEHADSPLANGVVAFMAGGDAALIRSVENFEDHPDYGERQLADLGFNRGDLFLGITEGGETPFVIGATLKAAELSDRPPFFLYCNPDDVLGRVAERSARVLADPRVNKINLTVGPMAVTGSTRMQASTALMAVAGAALLLYRTPEAARAFLEALPQRLPDVDPGFFREWIECESSVYRSGGQALYVADTSLAISVLTDTTERAPTFSMRPFENLLDPDPYPSVCHLMMPGCFDSAAAWRTVLWRTPRPLPWPGFDKIAGLPRLLGFDFSLRARERRDSFFAGKATCLTELQATAAGLSFKFDSRFHSLSFPSPTPLFRHLILKMILNAHSTLVMGRLGRYDGNVMTWVKPANHKLIDRAIRYADLLLRRKGVNLTYEEIAETCFERMEHLTHDQSLVHAVVQKLSMFEQR